MVAGLHWICATDRPTGLWWLKRLPSACRKSIHWGWVSMPKMLARCRESGGKSQFCMSHKACLVNTFRKTVNSTSLLSPSCTVGAEGYFALEISLEWGRGVCAVHSRNGIVCTSWLVLIPWLQQPLLSTEQAPWKYQERSCLWPKALQ